MNEPLVSVHMITYNHRPYIAEAIESVLRQETDYPFELVIGEDCSTDGTRDLVFDYQRKHPDVIRVVTSDRNVGMFVNAHRTLEACRGRYVAFCEGDDYWHRPWKLHRQALCLETCPDCSMVCSDFDTLFMEDHKLVSDVNRKRGRDPSKIQDIKYVLRGTPTSGILTCTVTVRRDLALRAHKANEEIFGDQPQPCGDTPMWTALFRLGRIAYIDESLATYRQIVVSATRNPSPAKVLRTSIAMKEQMLRLIDVYGLPAAEKALHLQDLWKRHLRLAF